jgi:hypothetical protein
MQWCHRGAEPGDRVETTWGLAEQDVKPERDRDSKRAHHGRLLGLVRNVSHTRSGTRLAHFNGAVAGPRTVYACKWRLETESWGPKCVNGLGRRPEILISQYIVY